MKTTSTYFSILTLALLLFLAGCQSDETTTAASTANSSAPTPTATTRQLTVTTTGGSASTISLSTGSANCGTGCNRTYAPNTSVTLTATPASGWQLDSWSGSGISCPVNAARTCTVTMDVDRTVGANFSAFPSVPPPPPPSNSAGLVIFYTDIVSGPNSDGEGGHGAYLTIFGAGFGDTRGTSQVTINNVPVAAYRHWSRTKITVQPGAGVTNTTPGAIRVTVGSNSYSDPNIAFTVVPGDIYFVALNGNDTNGAINDINQPFRTVNGAFDRADFGPGDHIVMRGGTWTDRYAQYSSFFSIAHKGGTAAAPIAIMGYPGEAVRFVRTTQTRGIHVWSSPGYFTIANMAVDLQQGGGGLMTGVGTVGVRLVNNEITGMWQNSGGAAMIDGSGKNFRILGNHVHDGGGSKLYHGIYMDGRDTSGPDDIEIAYNHIHHIKGGRGVQIYGDTGTPINNVRIHHNLIHHIALDGILFSRDTGTGMLAYNNVVYHTADPTLRGGTNDEGTSGGCIRFTNPDLVAEVYNNTFVDCAVDNNQYSAAILLHHASNVVLRNNLIVGKYFDVETMPASFTSSNNLWFGAGTAPSWDTSPQTGDPRFVNADTGAGTPDFHLQPNSSAIDRGSSAVSAIVTTDFDGIARPQGQSNVFDIGAYEYK